MRGTLKSIKETAWMTWEATFEIKPNGNRGGFPNVRTSSLEVSVELDFNNPVSKARVKTIAKDRVAEMFDLDYFYVR